MVRLKPSEAAEHDADADWEYCDGEDYYCSGWDSEYTGASYNVPGPATIALNAIDASNPTSVAFTYEVIGPPLVSLTMQLCGVTKFTSDQGSGLITFSTWDQNSYPLFVNTANAWGQMFGITIYAPGCDVDRETSAPNSGSNAYITVGGDEKMAPQTITVGHTVADDVTTVSYCTSAGGPTSCVDEATASMQLVNVDDVVIAVLNETHDYLSYSDPLHADDDPTLPEQTPQYQSRDLSYTNNWINSGVSAEICNTGLIPMDTNYQTILWGGTYSPSCSGFQLP